MNTLIVLLVASFAYWKVRNLYYNSIDQEFKYKLYRLRDHLRSEAIDGNIKSNDIFFDYLDSTISVAVKQMSSFNIISAWMLSRKNRHNQKYKDFTQKIDYAIKNNDISKRIYEEYAEIIRVYIFKKHYILRTMYYMLAGLIMSVSFLNYTYKNIAGRAYLIIRGLRTYPETSSLSAIVVNQ